MERVVVSIEALKDPSIFSELYHKAAPEIHAYVLSFIGNHTTAHALLLTLWNSIVRDLSQLRHAPDLCPVLYRRATSLMDEYAHTVNYHEAIGSERAHAEDHHTFMEFLKQLKSLSLQDRAIICLHLFSGLNNERIQRILDVSEEDIRHAMESLRQMNPNSSRQQERIPVRCHPRKISLHEICHAILQHPRFSS